MGKTSGKKTASKKVNGTGSKKIAKSKTLKVSKNGKASKAKAGDTLTVTKTFKVYKDQKDCFRDNKKYEGMSFATRALHAGNEPNPVDGGTCVAIDLSSTFAQANPGNLGSCFDYRRCGNPTSMAFQKNIASLEGTKYCLAFNSGLAAVVAVLTTLKQGDHLLCIDDIYAGVQRYLRYIHKDYTGIEFEYTDMTDLNKVRAKIKSNTRLVWMESPTNPTLKCTDIAGVAKLCKEKGALLAVDNTFMSPVLQHPIQLGADITMHSVTKYIGGHSDVLAGCLCVNDETLYDQFYNNMKNMGNGISPFDAYMALRGSKTMEIRVMKSCDNAMEVAKWLEKHAKIEKVLYPGLPSHPNHKAALKNRASTKLSGGSGMLCFYIKGDIKKTSKFLSSVKLMTLAESLGGVNTLIQSPAVMTHASVPPEKRKMLGIDDNLIRMSVGIEGAEDLINDLKQALAQI